MKEDMTGLAEKPRMLKPNNYRHVGFEGAFITLINKRYFLLCAEFNTKGLGKTYDCMVASSPNLFGPYGDRYQAIPHGGHNMLFRDCNGNLWSTFFGNDDTAPFRERPAILPVKINIEGRIQPDEIDRISHLRSGD
jgi:hypothetical protein